MKFLVIILQKQSPPREMMPALTVAMSQWVVEAKKTGKMEVLYSIAGQPGGLGIGNVDSLEELDDIVQGYPMTPFSEVQVFPLSDIDHAMATMREQTKKMGTLK